LNKARQKTRDDKIVVDITLTTNVNQRREDLDDLYDKLEDLPLDQEWDVVVTEAIKTREYIQNRLYWRWLHQWAKHQGNSIDWQHGELKLGMLLPVKLACNYEKWRRQAEFEQHVMDSLSDYSYQVRAAYSIIRSKKIPVRVFADFLTEFKRTAAEQGCHLLSKRDMEMEALMLEAESRG